ncbi:MAG: ATP-dependent Clp protease proteolytic subunit [Ruminococcus flavefaciens]|nr:ATP-dependent Clp protease proteolytic subunit [Ruminococcus flavefaciens]MCM1380756.1 ATP-dependent Clp protease proteolytic subunit [Muribaculaceae bacterium]MCM1479396.1 ATP-dependent Clp protease proteolytic subunit [Muribaculaceae bacterium]
MNIQVKSSSGITLVPIESRLMTNRKIFLEGEIDAVIASDFLKKVMILNSEDTSKYIDVLINSPGGEINSGMLIYDIIQSSKAPIRTFCIGRAYSMGAVLFASSNNGRFMLPNSQLMLHEVLLKNNVGGNSSSIKSISDSLLETQIKMNKILAKHTGKSEEEIEKATSFDHYMTPKESIEFGLCDKIVNLEMLLEG